MIKQSIVGEYAKRKNQLDSYVITSQRFVDLWKKLHKLKITY